MPLDKTEINETTRTLIEARGFIERGWCIGAQARDKRGKWVTPMSNEAVAWCAYGALLAAGASSHSHLAIQHLLALTDGDIAGFNNTQTDRAPILALFDAAIASSLNE